MKILTETWVYKNESTSFHSGLVIRTSLLCFTQGLVIHYVGYSLTEVGVVHMVVHLMNESFHKWKELVT
jgi:hypothetical protein